MVLKPYQIRLCGYIFSDRSWARQEILHFGAWIICVLGARLYGSGESGAVRIKCIVLSSRERKEMDRRGKSGH